MQSLPRPRRGGWCDRVDCSMLGRTLSGSGNRAGRQFADGCIDRVRTFEGVDGADDVVR